MRPTAWTVQTITIPAGDRGTNRTLAEMRRFVNEGVTDATVRRWAINITSGCGLDTGCQVALIRSWLERAWHFVRDPVGVELVFRPERLLDKYTASGQIDGDCDDAAVLAAALGKSIGLPARFVVLGFFGPRMPFSHVYTELRCSGGWAEMDVTRIPSRPPATRTKVVIV